MCSLYCGFLWDKFCQLMLSEDHIFYRNFSSCSVIDWVEVYLLFYREPTRSLLERESLKLILLKPAHFGTFIEVLTECGYSSHWLSRFLYCLSMFLCIFWQFLDKLTCMCNFCGFQAMVIVAWSSSGSLLAFFEEDVFRRVTSIFITQAFLNFLQGTGDLW